MGRCGGLGGVAWRCRGGRRRRRRGAIVDYNFRIRKRPCPFSEVWTWSFSKSFRGWGSAATGGSDGGGVDIGGGGEVVGVPRIDRGVAGEVAAVLSSTSILSPRKRPCPFGEDRTWS